MNSAYQEFTALHPVVRAVRIAPVLDDDKPSAERAYVVDGALRRTFATYFEAAGAVGMRAQLGHSTEAMSLQYVRRGFADHVAAVNRMAGFLLGETGGTKQ